MPAAPRIVLVRPRNPLNIGAVARAMANFGFDDLVVVDPYPPTWERARTTALTAAVGGEHVLEKARNVATLREALPGCTRVVGTSTGSRRNLGREVIPPAALRRRVGRGRLAILFGNEKSGLANDDLTYCHLLVRIPTVAAAPSMNLSHAVAVCCYEWARGRTPAVRKETSAPVDSLLRLLDIVTPILEASAFLDGPKRDVSLRRFRQMLLHANLCADDVQLLMQAARKIEYRLGRPSRV